MQLFWNVAGKVHGPGKHDCPASQGRPSPVLEPLASSCAPESLENRGHSKTDGIDRAIRMLRSQVIKRLINACVEVYADIAEPIDTGTLKKNAYGSGLVGYCRHAESLEAIRSFSKANIYKAQATQEARKVYGHAMGTALEGLASQLLAALENDGRIDPNSQVELAGLPGSRFAARVPADPNLAFPWLLNQITLLSDR